MANSKNTIQNIPLTGQLCLNTLKTDVAPFEGYNEKNTTVFGGELTPLWKKESEIDSLENSYTIYNSKGHSFTIKEQLPFNKFSIYDNQKGKYLYNRTGVCPVTIKLELPTDAVWGSMFILSERELSKKELLEVYLKSNGQLYYRKIAFKHEDGDAYQYWADKELDKAINDLPWVELDRVSPDTNINVKAVVASYSTANQPWLLVITVLLSDHNKSLYCYSNLFSPTSTSLEQFSDNSRCYQFIEFLSGGDLGNHSLLSTGESDSYYGGDMEKHISIVVKNSGNGDIGKCGLNDTVKSYFLSYRENSGWSFSENTNGLFRPMYVGLSNGRHTGFSQSMFHYNEGTHRTCSLSPYTGQECVFQNDNVNSYAAYSARAGELSITATTGHDGEGFIPGIIGTNKNSLFRFYCRKNNLMAITYGGMHIATPNQFSNNYVSLNEPIIHRENPYDTNYRTVGLNYKSGNNWYFIVLAASEDVLRMFCPDGKSISSLLKQGLVIDNRYILHLTLEGSCIFDTETEETICKDGELGYVSTFVPSGDTLTNNFTGCMYSSGYNAGYAIKGGKFVGYLENPNVMTYFPNYMVHLINAEDNGNIQTYFSAGDSVQSAEYFGKDMELEGTVYPIDVNGNVILPIALNNRIINGFSNNDMIILNNVAYPMIYYNNQKLYSYQLLSGIDGITGVFSLQGQRYLFDDDNIYTASFDNGVVSNVQPVCYKKSLVYLGSLPKAAIFYSFYNKTFYQFTGDVIVSKMFEANDINEIYSVAQNPATLSLWICTDSGVYILSDNDMFKLEYNSRNVFFYENRTNIISTDETGKTSSNVISLYKLEDDQSEQPIKLHTKFYGIGAEQKVTYDCWYIRLHNRDHKAGKLKLKVNTITNTSFETEEKTYDIEPSMYDGNDTIFIRYQPKYQSAVAAQLELESDIAIYQISLGVNTTDAVAQQSKFNF